jgi:lipopolysaccharide/colanic/teichoic acid biosynthesis glycosyltransferase
MGKRLLDIVVALVALIAAAPLLLAACVGIKLSSPGPVVYRARRVARDRRRLPSGSFIAGHDPERRRNGYVGREFTMFKLRTMHVDRSGGAPITGMNDSRVFPFGAWLRRLKIDELLQFVNVLKGDMSLVGPRPEDPEIVRAHYTPEDLLTLRVAPGITSPGTIYYYTHGEQMLAGDRVLELYLERLLPAKLALDRVYLRRTTVLYDIQVIRRTAMVILARAIGSQRFPHMPELVESGVRLDSQQPSRTSPA